jgi:hypothetical protein
MRHPRTPVATADDRPEEQAVPSEESATIPPVRSDRPHSDSLPSTLHLEQLKAVSAPAQASVDRSTAEVAVHVSAADQATRRTSDRPPPKVPVHRLRVIRGMKLNVEYPIADGANYIGRWDSEVVEIDLSDQEPADRVWSSRRHALLTFSSGIMTLEDLHSLNGTFVNRRRLYPGQTRVLSANDVILIGTVQLQVLV